MARAVRKANSVATAAFLFSTGFGCVSEGKRLQTGVMTYGVGREVRVGRGSRIVDSFFAWLQGAGGLKRQQSSKNESHWQLEVEVHDDVQ